MKVSSISTLKALRNARVPQRVARVFDFEMRSFRTCLFEPSIWVATMFVSPAVLAASFVAIQVESTEVRLGPTTTSELIGVVKRSTILETRGNESGWLKVVLPSGEYRYVLSKFTQPVGSLPPFVPPAEMPLVCSELLQAERRSADEASRIEPNIMKQIDLQRVRSDRYKIAIFAKHGIHLAHNTAASVWCVKR